MRLKTKHWILVWVAVLLTPGALFAQRVAVINFDQVVAESMDGQAVGERLQVQFDELSVNLQQQEEALAGLQEQLTTQERVLSPTALAQLQRQVQNAQTRLTRDTEDAQVEFEAMQNELLLPVFEKAQGVFQQYAAEEDYVLIFNTAAPESGLIYAANTIDITTEIIRRMDAATEAASGGAAAPAPTPEP